MLNKKALSAAFGVEKDADFKQTVLLLHGDGTNGAQNNTFTDSSTNAFTITRNGNTTQGTFSPFSLGAGEWSNYFDGTGDYLSSSKSQTVPATGDFTVDGWFYLNTSSYSNFPSIFSQGTSGTSGRFVIFINNDGKLAVQITTSLVTFGSAVTPFQWNYFAVTRSGSTITVYLNGSSIGTTTNSDSIQNTTPLIGSEWNGDPYRWQGYLSNIRVSNTIRSISLPTAPFTSDANTTLLACQSNRFVDTSGTPATLTPFGNTSVQPFSPFAPSAAYSTSTNGGSGYFDGSGDYLSVPDNAAFDYGSGNFTLECWIYPTISNNGVLLTAQTSGALYGPCNLYFSSGELQLYSSSNNSSFDVASGAVIGTPQVNAWSHVAVSRDGNSIRCFLNGVLGSTTTSSATLMNATGAFEIAAREGSQFYTGYISGFRVVKGTAVYTAAFTPPTAPLTAITNTSLLCNFTGAAIFDQTGKNNLETVGNAQIDTTTKKFGTGSMKFDGTGDSLDIVQTTPFLSVWTGDFTIECWAYTNNLSAQHIVWANKGTDSSGYNAAYINTNGSIGMGRAGVNEILSASSTWTSGQWNHLAFVRNGSNLTIYYNGTSVATTTSASTYLTTTATGFSIGKSFQTSPAYFNGYIDDFRVTYGVARYTANFTAPTKAFADQ